MRLCKIKSELDENFMMEKESDEYEASAGRVYFPEWNGMEMEQKLQQLWLTLIVSMNSFLLSLLIVFIGNIILPDASA